MSLVDIENDLLGVTREAGQSFLVQLKIPNQQDLFGQVNERAVAWAKEHAADLVTGIDETTRADLRDIIAGGLEDNVGLDGIIERLQDAYPFSAQRAELIARTEVATANGQGALEGMRLARERGVKLKKVWVPDDEACDVCVENGDAGPIDIDEDFPSGDDTYPAHPNCECDVASEVEEESESELDDEEEE